MPYGLKLLTPPTTEPLTLAEAKAYLRVEVADEDELIASLISAGRQVVESQLRRSLVTSTWRLSLDSFPLGSYPAVRSWSGSRAADAELSLDPYTIALPRSPLVGVDSIKYYDVNGALQTLSTSVYAVDAEQEPGRIVLSPGQSWPGTQIRAGAVQIQFQAGYGYAELVPEPIKTAIKLLVGHWYENREAVMPGTMSALPLAVESLLAPYEMGVYA